jgi:hypothetical protein
MGLVWQSCGPELYAIYVAPLTSAEVEARIARYWQPDHEARAAARARHWALVHLDCHSMARLRDLRSPHPDGPLRPDFDLGVSVLPRLPCSGWCWSADLRGCWAARMSVVALMRRGTGVAGRSAE